MFIVYGKNKGSFQEPEHRALMARSGTLSVHLLLVISLSAVFVATGGRLLPLLQDYEKAGFSRSFHRIYDTSKYGIFQLNNGLAQTPQMGQVSFPSVILILKSIDRVYCKIHCD